MAKEIIATPPGVFDAATKGWKYSNAVKAGNTVYLAGQVALDAVFPYARDSLSYPDFTEQGLHPHKVREVLLWASEDINYRSDITKTFHLKLAALRCHKSQVGHIPSKQLEEWLRQRHKLMAEGENFQLAEAFHRVEILR